MAIEIWRDVKDFEQFYEVSNLGHVRSKNRMDRLNRQRIGQHMKQSTNNCGYKQVVLSVNGKTYMKLVHRLVADAFVVNQDPKLNTQVNHLDEDKGKGYNRSSNLEWCTAKYNRHYGTCIERMAANRDYKKIMENRGRAVEQIDPSNQAVVGTFDNIAEASRQTGVNDTSISFVVREKRKSAGSFNWRYKES